MTEDTPDAPSANDEVSIASKIPRQDKALIRTLASVNGTTMSKWVADALQEKIDRTPERTLELARELAEESGQEDEGNERRGLVSAD